MQKFSNSALIIVDCQKIFFNENMRTYLPDSKKILGNIIDLIDFYRAHNIPLVFTRHAHKKGESTGQMGRWWNENLPWENTKEAELIDEIKTQKNDIILTKTVYSAFEQTNLDSVLRDKNIINTVICGVMTNLCVETTARHAFMKNFQPIVISDACASKNLDYHNATLLNLSYGFAYIETTKNILEKIS